MKVLLDSCLSGKTAEMLRTAGHDVVWVGNWPADPGDAAILARARAERRILVTLDKDFVKPQSFAVNHTAVSLGW